MHLAWIETKWLEEINWNTEKFEKCLYREKRNKRQIWSIKVYTLKVKILEAIEWISFRNCLARDVSCQLLWSSDGTYRVTAGFQNSVPPVHCVQCIQPSMLALHGTERIAWAGGRSSCVINYKHWQLNSNLGFLVTAKLLTFINLSLSSENPCATSRG